MQALDLAQDEKDKQPSPIPHKIIIPIKRSTKQERSKVFFKEQSQLLQRVRKTMDNLEDIRKTLNIIYNNSYKHKNGIKLAIYLSQKFGIRIDRQAKRYKEALLCWFSENWDKFGPILSELITKNRKSDDIKKQKEYQNEPNLESVAIFQTFTEDLLQIEY